MAGLAVWPSDGTRVEVEWESEYIRLPGIASWEETVNDAPRRVVRALEAIASVTGDPEPPTVACEVISYAARHPAWRTVREAAFGNKAINVRLFTPPTEHLFTSAASDGAMCDIAINGVCTFADGAGQKAPDFKEDTFAPGMAIQIGTKWYTILDISDAGAVRAVDDTTNKYPDSAVAAGRFRVSRVRMGRDAFAAKISSADGASIRTENQLSAGFNLNPINRPPEFVFEPPVAL